MTAHSAAMRRSEIRNAEFGITHRGKSVYGAGAPSPPSEEGGGTAYKGLKRRDGRRDTPSICESTWYRRAQSRNNACINLYTPAPLCKQQPRVLSPSVAPLNPFGAPAPSSEGAEAALRAASPLFPKNHKNVCARRAHLNYSSFTIHYQRKFPWKTRKTAT